MAGRGGYQAPNNPAPASGPGSLSQRTDGGPGQPIREVPAAYYGERQEMRDIQGGATMAQDAMPTGSPVSLSAAPTPPPAPMTPPTPLFDPTQAPDEPVTAGAASGPGPGPEALNLPNAREDNKRLIRYLPAIMQQAENPDSGPQIKLLAQYLRGIANA